MVLHFNVGEYVAAFFLKVLYITVKDFFIGRLAQLVQSTSFTPRGSGVRIPHRPPYLKSFKNIHKINLRDLKIISTFATALRDKCAIEKTSS